jgi:hypothetical protein
MEASARPRINGAASVILATAYGIVQTLSRALKTVNLGGTE